MKKGEKFHKNASFWVINFALRPRPRKLFRGGKKRIPKGGGGGNDRIAQYIPLYYVHDKCTAKSKIDIKKSTIIIINNNLGGRLLTLSHGHQH